MILQHSFYEHHINKVLKNEKSNIFMGLSEKCFRHYSGFFQQIWLSTLVRQIHLST